MRGRLRCSGLTSKIQTGPDDAPRRERKETFEDGVLEMHCAYALRTDGMFGDNHIRELLTEKL